MRYTWKVFYIAVLIAGCEGEQNFFSTPEIAKELELQTQQGAKRLREANDSIVERYAPYSEEDKERTGFMSWEFISERLRELNKNSESQQGAAISTGGER